jgi:hypothetical protein
MVQFLALSILCCCAAVAVADYLRHGVLAVQKKSITSSQTKPTDNQAREIIY